MTIRLFFPDQNEHEELTKVIRPRSMAILVALRVAYALVVSGLIAGDIGMMVHGYMLFHGVFLITIPAFMMIFPPRCLASRRPFKRPKGVAAELLLTKENARDAQVTKLLEKPMESKK